MENQPKFHFNLLAVIFLFACNAVRAASFPMADKVPGDAVLYIGWAGADSQATAYRESDLSAFVDHSNLPAMVQQYAPQIFAKITGDSGDDKKKADAIKQVLPLLWRHPTAIYMADITAARNSFDAEGALICDAGDDADELQVRLQKLIGNNPHQKVSVEGTIVTLAAEHARKNNAASMLIDAPAFKAAMKSMQQSPTVAVYVDGQQVLSIANQAADQNPDSSTIWPKVRDALGISDLKTFAMTAGFDHGNWMSSVLLDAPAPRKGLLAVIEPKPIDPALLARIPSKATSVSVTNFDVALLFDTIGQAMAVTKQSDTMFHQAAGLATVGLGRNFRRQILGPLGPQWVSYSDPTTHGIVVLNHPNNADDASDGLVSATFGLVNLANSQLSGPDKKTVVDIDQKTVKGIDLTSAVTEVASPSFAVKAKILYVGATPDSVIAAANSPAVSGEKDVLHNPAFIAALKRVGATDLVAFNFCNLPATAPEAYENFPAEQSQIHQLMKLFDIDLPNIELPSLDQMTGHLSPAISVTWADADGIYSKSVAPFPGAVQLLGNPQGTLMGTKTALGIATLAQPAIQKARGRAVQVKCASNERQIGLGCMLYANDNKGKYPDDLGTLLTNEDMVAGVFLCPSKTTALPANFATMKKDEQAKWVNDNTDYIYLGKGMKMADNGIANQIILYEKDGAHEGQGMNLLFGDGHVEYRAIDDAKKLLQNQQGGM